MDIDNDAHTRAPGPDHSWPGLGLVRLVRAFYTDRAGRLALYVCVPVLVYGGGAIMFWFHAVYLGEGGPAIPDWVHWLLDSTVGLVALTPVIAVILPLAVWWSRGRRPDDPRTRRGGRREHGGRHAVVRVRPGRAALLGGLMLALVTAPAPLVHDRVVGRGTRLADQATQWWGDGREPIGEAQEVPALVEMAQQVGAGIPTYVVLMWLVLLVVHGFVPLTSPRPAPAPLARDQPRSDGRGRPPTPTTSRDTA